MTEGTEEQTPTFEEEFALTKLTVSVIIDLIEKMMKDAQTAQLQFIVLSAQVAHLKGADFPWDGLIATAEKTNPEYAEDLRTARSLSDLENLLQTANKRESSY